MRSHGKGSTLWLRAQLLSLSWATRPRTALGHLRASRRQESGTRRGEQKGTVSGAMLATTARKISSSAVSLITRCELDLPQASQVLRQARSRPHEAVASRVVSAIRSNKNKKNTTATTTVTTATATQLTQCASLSELPGTWVVAVAALSWCCCCRSRPWCLCCCCRCCCFFHKHFAGFACCRVAQRVCLIIVVVRV